MCMHCFASHTVLPVGRRLRSAFDYVPATSNARDLQRSIWQSVRCAAYPLAVGAKSVVLVTGPAGGGKSTFSGRFVDSLVGAPPVSYYAAEEGLGPALAARLRRANVKRESFAVLGRGTSCDDVVAHCREHHSVGLVIDSVQEASWSASELRHVLGILDELQVLVAVSQINAGGLPSGQPQALRHEADIVLSCAAMRWKIEKSRFEDVGAEGPVLG
jgi:hypothetical protein